MTPRYIASDTAKCAGNPTHDECKTCLRYTLPVNPDAYRQVWMAVWIMDEPCSSRWYEPTDWSAA